MREDFWSRTLRSMTDQHAEEVSNLRRQIKALEARNDYPNTTGTP